MFSRYLPMGRYFGKKTTKLEVIGMLCLGAAYILSQIPPVYIIGLILLLGIAFLIWAITSIFSKPKSYIDSRGYVVLTKFNELEHRYIAKQVLKRDLARNEIVHHINGKKTDNSVSNLCLMDREKHEHFHSWLMWKKKKSGKYPPFSDQRRILESEYGGTLLEFVKCNSGPVHGSDFKKERSVDFFVINRQESIELEKAKKTLKR